MDSFGKKQVSERGRKKKRDPETLLVRPLVTPLQLLARTPETGGSKAADPKWQSSSGGARWCAAAAAACAGPAPLGADSLLGRAWLRIRVVHADGAWHGMRAVSAAARAGPRWLGADGLAGRAWHGIRAWRQRIFASPAIRFASRSLSLTLWYSTTHTVMLSAKGKNIVRGLAMSPPL
jgi:hypothetical protein